jgi:hypothetical protein
MALPPESRTRYLWEAHEFCETQLGQGRFTDAELSRNLGVLGKMMHEVAKHLAERRREEGTWSDSLDARWPRNHKGADPEHYYDSGSYPPQLLAFPTNPESWRTGLADKPEALFDEMIAWSKTPAGKSGVGEVELQKLLADRDTYLPHASRADSPSPQASSAEIERRESKGRTDGMGWLWDKSADGSLSDWANKLKLAGISQFLTGSSSNRRPMERLLPELMAIEKAGEWQQLEQHLTSESPSEAAMLAKLRGSLPKARVAL